MALYIVSDEAYKNGYAKGYEDGKRDAMQSMIRCVNCVRSDPKFCPREKVWCNEIGRYMWVDDFCSYGKGYSEGGE